MDNVSIFSLNTNVFNLPLWDHHNVYYKFFRKMLELRTFFCRIEATDWHGKLWLGIWLKIMVFFSCIVLVNDEFMRGKCKMSVTCGTWGEYTELLVLRIFCVHYLCWIEKYVEWHIIVCLRGSQSRLLDKKWWQWRQCPTSSMFSSQRCMWFILCAEPV